MKKIDISTPKYPNTFTLVDDEDYEYLSQWKWHKNYSGYVQRGFHTRLGKTFVKMHRVIMRPFPNLFVDHVNHDPLDNRRCNLRICTKSQNNMNVGLQKGRRYKGATRNSKIPRLFEAKINVNGKSKYLGLYPNEIIAALIYNAAAEQLFGNFANLNKIPILFSDEGFTR